MWRAAEKAAEDELMALLEESPAEPEAKVEETPEPQPQAAA